MYELGKSDFVKGLIVAVLGAIFTTLSGIFSQAGFDVFSANWGVILGDVLKVITATFVGYLGKNFFSDEDGNFAGIKV
jgi:hypothetical protein